MCSGGGYGTLQEYMIMDDLIDDIKPDAIILQFCNNDYTNNSYELDRKGYPFNNHHVRPYWENNDIVYRLPLPYPTLRKYSFTAGRILKLYDRKRWLDANNDLKKYRQRRQKNRNNLSPSAKEEQRSDNSNAVEVTKILFAKIQKRVGAIPVYFFNASGELTETDRSVCASTGFQCIEGIGTYMKNLEINGEEIRVVNDGHWNYRGNKYTGEKLVEYFQNNGGLASSSVKPQTVQ